MYIIHYEIDMWTWLGSTYSSSMTVSWVFTASLILYYIESPYAVYLRSFHRQGHAGGGEEREEEEPQHLV